MDKETSCEHVDTISVGSSPDPNKLEIVASCSPQAACSSSSLATSTAEMDCPASSNSNNNNQEPTSATPQIFRPIKFENTPATPEGNESESGSTDSTLDSAYCSDNAQPFRNAAGAQSFCKKVTASLQNKSLWKTFKRIGNEMIVTKPGRRLFPALLVSLHGLEPDLDYNISLRVATADDQRYRYINMKWCATGESEVIQCEDKQVFRHPSSPNTGHFWMKRPISFKSIKVTHYGKSKYGNMLLHTMHKYVIKLIIDHSDGSHQTVITLPDTTFIAVSAYQNVELTQLKIDNNPFAKGFRYKVRSPGVQSVNGNGNGSTGAAAPAIPSSPSFTSENPTLAYWQQLYMQGLLPPYHRPVLSMPAPASGCIPSPSLAVASAGGASTTQLMVASSGGSNGGSGGAKTTSLTLPLQHPPTLSSPLSIANGISPHFPMFYHHPYLPPPPYQVPTSTAQSTDEDKQENNE